MVTVQYGTYFGIDVFGCTVETTRPTTTTTTSTTSTSTTTSTTTSLNLTSAQGGIDTCYSELIETTQMYLLLVLLLMELYYYAKTTVKNGGQIRKYYRRLWFTTNYSSYYYVLHQQATTTTTTAAPTTPTGTINTTFVGYNSTGANFDVFTNDAVQTYIDFTIYPTGGGSYSERQVVPTVNGTTLNWSISWSGDIDTSNGGTGVANLVATNNLGTESTLDTDSFIIPTGTPTTTTTTIGPVSPKTYSSTMGLIFQGGKLSASWI